ncbi:hypothetical protein [Bacillus suaedae]|uniref:Uncharacterized protein n=1 Tax=Halalkalibacter suaedae TaxID=2822140 RepID=A0A940WYJ5_9BACI|nr:hypothetical protein [Bacillus suaedae]MBP3953192.1 hypothetical protein [Bacillus suaedae]
MICQKEPKEESNPIKQLIFVSGFLALLIIVYAIIIHPFCLLAIPVLTLFVMIRVTQLPRSNERQDQSNCFGRQYQKKGM